MRSRRLSETLEDHKRCIDRTAQVKRLRSSIRVLQERLEELGVEL